MLTQDDKTEQGIHHAVENTFRAEFAIWNEMKGRPEPRFDLTPDPGLGLDEGKWKNKLDGVISRLNAKGYPAFSEIEKWSIANNTVRKPIASCHLRLCTDIRSKLKDHTS